MDVVGTVKQICKVLDEFQRLLQRNISNLVLKRKDRAMFTTIDDFLEWLFKQTVEAQAKCRSRCMYLFDSICQVLQGKNVLGFVIHYIMAVRTHEKLTKKLEPAFMETLDW